MAEHKFLLTASWNGGRLGQGKIAVGNLKSTVSVPKELDGPGDGTNPEEMLVGAAATCYLITLAAVIERRGLALDELTLTTEGTVVTEGGLHFDKITHYPNIVLKNSSTDDDVKTAEAAAHRAEQACMISKALKGNVEVSVSPNVCIR